MCPANTKNFNVDNVRVVKITGSSLASSEVVQGLVLRRDTEGTVKRVTDAKVAVYGCAIDTSATETKGTVLIRTAAELEGYSAGEEARVEAAIKAIADTGATLLVTGQTIGEMAMHFVEKYGLMALKIPSKARAVREEGRSKPTTRLGRALALTRQPSADPFAAPSPPPPLLAVQFELRRFCRATNAVALIKFEPPTADELGFAGTVFVEEIGGTRCVVLRQADAASAVATVVLRGATDNVMDDVERAVDDGVNAYKALARDARLVPAGGAAEIAIAARLAAAARAETGLEQARRSPPALPPSLPPLSRFAVLLRCPQF